MIDLKSELVAMSNGQRIERPYTGELMLVDGQDGKQKALITIYQHFDNGNRGSVGRWYLETLLEGFNDSLSIDYGQNWKIAQGMRDMMLEACKILSTGELY